MTIMMKMFLVLLIAVNINSFSFDNNASNTKSNGAEAAIIKLGENKAPDFALKSFDGKTVKLSDYKGKVVIIDFWATWCPPCRKGIPDLISIQDEYKKDVVIIGISLDSEKTIKDVPGFVKSYAINYPIVYGNEKVVNDYGGIEGIPTAFVVDKKGNIVDFVFLDKAKNESEGTNKIIDLSGPIFDTLKLGKLLIIDELDAKLHPLITMRIVEIFHNPESNPNNAQLIFATHDTNLLGETLFRRDQIWFTEKDEQEQTDLYSLYDFNLPDGSKVRNDSNLEKNYIRGRYGAIPFITN